MKEAATIKKSAATTYLKEMAINSVIGVIAFLLVGLVVFLVIWSIRALASDDVCADRHYGLSVGSVRYQHDDRRLQKEKSSERI